MSADKEGRNLPASARRKQDARKEGRTARSPHVSAWLSLFVGTLVAPAAYHYISGQVVGLLKAAVADFATPSPLTAVRLLVQGLYVAAIAAGAIAFAMMALALAGQLGQGRPSLAFSKIKPKGSNISPKKGFKRIFSAQGGVELVRQILELALVAGVALEAAKSLSKVLAATTPVNLGALLALAGGRMLTMVRDVSVVGLAIGVGDYAWQRHQLNQSLKMTHREVKDENRQDQGSVEVRTARRRAALKTYRARMAGSVDGADVVVVNPVHVAVGLSYRAGSDAAPRVVARGAGKVAARLKHTARARGIPVVEEPELARGLHAACVVGDMVPVELYRAVAKLFAVLYAGGGPVSGYQGGRPAR
ncbi:MAG: EscU/YscU/HrcU family type III secretion system export apparatus switch protein [Acidimicrobiales bacterium]